MAHMLRKLQDKRKEGKVRKGKLTNRKPPIIPIARFDDVITIKEAFFDYQLPNYNTFRTNLNRHKVLEFYSHFGLARQNEDGLWLVAKQALDDYFQCGDYYNSANSLWDKWEHLRVDEE